MPLSNILKSAAGTCLFCQKKAGILSRQHQECRRTFQAGWDGMVQLAAQEGNDLDLMIHNGVEVVDLDLDKAKDLLREFIERNPREWSRDIGR